MTDEHRPDPDALLASTRAAEEKRERGELRVYLGMCPGVGKTFTMLDEARRLARERKDVVVGLAETHGRAETETLLQGLEVLPRRTVEYRGTQLSEFDLDAAIRRQPALVLVDELAHTNAPGSRHPKRWQDVRELIDAGIDVWTTVNIQHLESLRDAVARITGIRVQEAVPDSFFDLADEIRVIDITPDQLRERLREGKVYLGERARAATEGFFREGNLNALREMALRFTAQRVDLEMRDYMRRNLIVGPWRSGERLLVAVGPSPYSERLVRLTRRLAGTLHASWLAVHVETGEKLSEPDSQRLAGNLALARSLGAEVVSVSGSNTADAILETARRENVSQIVAGKPMDARWWLKWMRPSIADRLAHRSGEIDILLVHPTDDENIRASRGFSISGGTVRLRDWAIAAGLLVATTIVSYVVKPWIGYQSVPMLYLVVVLLTGIYLRRRAVLALAVGSALAWNFFFTEPEGTFVMVHSGDAFIFAALLAAALVVGHLTTCLHRREESSEEGEERARALYQLTRVTAASVDFEQAVQLALKHLREIFEADAALLLSDKSGEITLFAGREPDGREHSVCQWAGEHHQSSGRFTDTLPESTLLAIPLLSAGDTVGVLAVWPVNEALRSPLRRDLLDAFAAHVVVLIEKETMLKSAREARVAAASQRLQRALLDQVSHELKTPVAVIQAAVEQLAEGTTQSGELLAEIRQATRRLNRVVTQLVTLSRVEAGLIQPRIEVCDAHDFVAEVCADLGEAAQQVRVETQTFRFRADPGLLHTALSNLLLNAVQHSPAEASIDLQAACRPDGSVEFVVTDTGTGVPTGERERIFERFARGSGARPGGMGLGLSIARHFIEAHGGTLVLESAPEKGTVFKITLPPGTSSAPDAQV